MPSRSIQTLPQPSCRVASVHQEHPHRTQPSKDHKGTPDYRRNRVAGGSYFFTVTLQDRRSDLSVREIVTRRTAVRATRARHPFHIDACVVLPDHMHCVWTLPPDDVDVPARWQMTKALFSRSMPRPETRRASLVRSERPAYGSGITGNTPSATGRTMRLTWTTSTSTQ